MNQKSKLKVIFFDIGGVLLSNGWDHISRQKAAERFHFSYSETEPLHQSFFSFYEVGSLTLDQYLDAVYFNQKRDFSKDDFKSFLFSQSQELPQTLAWLKEWRKDCRVKLFSLNNEGKEINQYRIEKFGLHLVFDAFISSCAVGLRKPDPRIYHLAMDVAMVKNHECIYFDDRYYLVEAAKKLGMQAIQHQDFETTKSILQHVSEP